MTPLELLVLMGVSQTSYVVPKYWNGTPAAAPPKNSEIYDEGDPGLASWQDWIMDFFMGFKSGEMVGKCMMAGNERILVRNTKVCS